jgi:hypothetical protein
MVFEIPLKLSSSQHYPTYFYYLKYPKHSTHSPPFPIYQYSSSLSFPFQKKSHKKKQPKIPFPQAFQNPSFCLFSLSHGSWGNLLFQFMAFSPFKNQWKLRMICPPIDFRTRILMPNETLKRFHLLIKIGWQSSWLMGLEDSSFPLFWIYWWGSWAWSLSLPSVWPSRPIFSS